MSQTAYWPWPPDCLTCRPWPLDGPAKVSRSDTRSGTESTATPYRFASRSSSTSTCASPMHHSTSWWVSGFMLQAHRRVLGDQPGQALRQLVLVGLAARDDRHRQQRLGHHPRLHEQRGVLVRERVAGLGPGQLGDRDDVAGHRDRHRALVLAQRRGQRADPLVDVVVLVTAVGRSRRNGRSARTRGRASGRSVPQKTRTRLTRPTYGSVVVFTTSATSGPAGSAVSGSRGSPSGVVTGGSGCSSGDGKPRVTRSSSSRMPSPLARRRREDRVERAAGDGRLQVVTRTSRSMSSPPR